MLRVPHIFFLFLIFCVIQISFGRRNSHDLVKERNKLINLAGKDCFNNNKCWFDKHCGSKGHCVKQKHCKKRKNRCANYGREIG